MTSSKTKIKTLTVA